jgi:hypothetical protein
MADLGRPSRAQNQNHDDIKDVNEKNDKNVRYSTRDYFIQARRWLRDNPPPGLADWESSRTNGADIDPTRLEGFHPPALKSGFNHQPLFTNFVEGRTATLPNGKVVTPTILDQPDERFILCLNDKMPYTDAYPDAPETAGMSLVHFFGIAKERMYNAVSFNNDDATIELLEAMRNAAKAYVDKAKVDGTLKALVEQTFANTKPNFLGPADQRTPAGLRFDEHFKAFETFNSADMTFCVHPHPKQSIGAVHLHCLAGPRTSLEHEYKNLPLDDVIAVLKAGL